jgi:hypothetical protein
VRVDETSHHGGAAYGRDPAFEATLRIASTDLVAKKRLRETVRAWMQER